MKKTFHIYFILSIASGLTIAWIDSRPHWDDTGITARLILLAATLFGFLSYEKTWLIALAVSIRIPVWAIVSTQNYGTLLAFIPGFTGAYAGYLIHYLLSDI